MKTAVAALAAVVLTTTAVLGHQLNVFAYVEGGTVIVESRFSNGNAPRVGEVRVLDAANALLMTLPIAEDGTARFPLDAEHAADGLLIEVSTTSGHDNYWILTPEDIARGTED